MSRLEIAKKVRKAAEKGYSQRGKAHGKVGGKDLGGHCQKVSIDLAIEFHRAGYTDATVVGGDYYGKAHYWVVSDGYIYDLTASQFGVKQKVFVVEVSKASHKPADLDSLPEDLKRLLKKQIPLTIKDALSNGYSILK